MIIIVSCLVTPSEKKRHLLLPESSFGVMYMRGDVHICTGCLKVTKNIWLKVRLSGLLTRNETSL